MIVIMHMKRSLKVIVSIGIALLSMFILSGCSNGDAKAVIGCPRDDTSVEIMVVDEGGTPKEYIPKQNPEIVIKSATHKSGSAPFDGEYSNNNEASLTYDATSRTSTLAEYGNYRLRVTCKGKRSNWIGRKSSSTTKRDFTLEQTDKADSFLFDKGSSVLKASSAEAKGGTYYIRCYSPEDSKEILKEHTAEADIVCEATGYANS